MGHKDADRIANSVDPDQTALFVCSDLCPKLRIITVGGLPTFTTNLPETREGFDARSSEQGSSLAFVSS